ncbi:DUF3616 domain-containing protein [Thermoactinospora rubra]|uniref:DUF3616 domain-containing protein n=1 Tax=Thermoactinospora rubra TaxID=1088767 RepID=UPI00117E9308|nr:DUF3616 domain-containing protein [Thermoactinospora rubra]
MNRVELRFDEVSRAARTHTNLSAVRGDSGGLWVAGDETATVEHLTWTGEMYAGQRSFRLGDYVDLPAGPDDEADIEGLALHEGHLWAIGSHSLKRRRVKPTSKDPERRLATVVREENRFVLVRLPLRDGVPAKGAIMAGAGNLAAHLRDDPHLGPFLALPGKDNGLDIEGIAVAGGRVYVGLRGPVLRGWACVLSLRVEADGARLRMREPYRKHFLNLGGLGVRDMCPYGEDLLLLAGPSMDLDGPVRLARWRPDPGRTVEHEVEVVAELPHGVGCDRPEGVAVLPGGGLLVVYDSPCPDRLTPEGVYADVIALG